MSVWSLCVLECVFGQERHEMCLKELRFYSPVILSLCTCSLRRWEGRQERGEREGRWRGLGWNRVQNPLRENYDSGTKGVYSAMKYYKDKNTLSLLRQCRRFTLPNIEVKWHWKVLTHKNSTWHLIPNLLPSQPPVSGACRFFLAWLKLVNGFGREAPASDDASLKVSQALSFHASSLCAQGHRHPEFQRACWNIISSTLSPFDDPP